MSLSRVNAHTHIYSGLAPLGMPPPEPAPENFVQILERVWWRLDRALDEASLRASARLYAAESLLFGTTGLIDHHESPAFIEGSLDVIADECQALGLPTVVCYGATERNGGRAEARAGLGECTRFLRDNTRPLVRGVIGLHASFTASEETLRDAGELARQHDTVVHVHVAEDGADVEHARAQGHAGPLQRLLAADALPRGSILAHGVHLSREDIELCNERGLWLVHNPRSNEGNRVGWASVLAHAERVGLGTDGWAADMDAELAAARRLAAEHGEDPAAGERRLAAGSALLAERFGGAPPAVRVDRGRVFVDDREVVQDGVLLSGDLEAIRADAAVQAAALWERMTAL